MKTITSKNTWYFIFGFLFILLISLVIYRSMFGGKNNQLDADSIQNKDSYISDASEKDSPTEQISLFDSPATGTDNQTINGDNAESNSTEKKGLALLPDIIQVDPTSSPTPSYKTPPATESTQVVTESSNLKVIADKDGATFVSTENADGSSDIARPKTNGVVILEFLKLPAGYATDVGSLINDLLRLVMVIAALLVFGQLIWGGISWITSGGDKTKIEEARGKIVAAVVGLIVVASSYAILQLVLTFLGISSLNELFQTSFQRTTPTTLQEKNATASATIIIDSDKNNIGDNGEKTKGGL